MRARIVDVDYYLPSSTLTNDELARDNPDWDMDMLFDKLGIRQRRVAKDDETALDLAESACQKLLARRLVPAHRIDFLLLCTQSPDYYLPTGACMLQHRLGLGKHTGALEFNLGCSGYIYGLALAKALISCGQASHVLLATADTYSKYIHPKDRTVRPLFGDGASATLVGPSDGSGQIGEILLRTDGKGAKNLIVPAGGLRTPRTPLTATEETDSAGCVRSRDHLFMDGKAIFTFAILEVPRMVKELLDKTGLTFEDVDWFVYHQANKFMLGELVQRTGIPPRKAVMSFENVGNTVSSSIPIAIKDYLDAEKIAKGDKIILVGFGVGYSYGACELTWGSDK